MSRRSFLQGMAAILAAGVAPAAVGSGILMPVRKIWTTRRSGFTSSGFRAAVWCMGWSISNGGSVDLILNGLHYGTQYSDAGDVIIRPGETITYDAATGLFSK